MPSCDWRAAAADCLAFKEALSRREISFLCNVLARETPPSLTDAAKIAPIAARIDLRRCA